MKATNDPSHWSERLPIVSLGIGTAVKTDLGYNVAERVYGTTLCLPSEFFAQSTLINFCTNLYQSTTSSLDPTSYVDRLRRIFQDLQPPPTRPRKRTAHVPTDLQTCTHVFVRRDAVRKLLQPPNDGPFKVLSRTPKHSKIDLGTRTDSISIDRLKCAHLDTATFPHLPPYPTVRYSLN